MFFIFPKIFFLNGILFDSGLGLESARVESSILKYKKKIFLDKYKNNFQVCFFFFFGLGLESASDDPPLYSLPPSNGRGRNFLFFLRTLQRFHQQCVNSSEEFKRYYFNSLATMVVQRRKNRFLEPLKHLFYHSENTSFSNKIV